MVTIRVKDAEETITAGAALEQPNVVRKNLRQVWRVSRNQEWRFTKALNPSRMCFRSHRPISMTGNLSIVNGIADDFWGASHERYVSQQNSCANHRPAVPVA